MNHPVEFIERMLNIHTVLAPSSGVDLNHGLKSLRLLIEHRRVAASVDCPPKIIPFSTGTAGSAATVGAVDVKKNREQGRYYTQSHGEAEERDINLIPSVRSFLTFFLGFFA